MDNEASITLKWGTLKSWHLTTDAQMACLQRFFEDPVPMSVMMHHNTEAQKQAICDLINLLSDDVILLEWDDRYVSREEAKQYIMEYGRSK